MRPGSPSGFSTVALTFAAVSGIAFAGLGCTGKLGETTGAGAGSGNAGSGSGTPTGLGGSAGTGSGTTGIAGATGAGGTSITSGLTCAQVGVDTAPSVLRRLSNLEYQLTLQDLFQLAAPPATDSIPPDVDRDGFRTFASIQNVSAQHLRAYVDRAHVLADELMADATRRARVLGCEPTASGCLRAFVTRFGKLAFRRPLETVEIDAIVNRATTDALDATDQFRFAIEVMLSSSSFLYRVEVGPSADPLATLTPYELASRLSFTLWGRAPDNALLDQAAAGALGTADGLDATASTMLADRRAQVFYEAFFRQWLGFEGMGAPPNPPSGWSNALVADMVKETQAMVGDFAWGSGRNFLDVLTANYTRPTAALASYFGVPAPAADGTSTFPSGHVRANTGLLTHPSLLSAKRDGDLISIRGNWLRRTFLCRSISIPAEVAEDLGEILVGLNRVEIVQKRNTEAQCKSCHAAIDPVGIGFVQFDHTGRFDATINATEYGIAAALPDAASPSFSTLGELATKVREMPQVAACLANRVFTYANGREPERADTCAVEAAGTAFAGNGNSFAAMLKGMVTAPTFRLRRAPGVTP